MQGKCRGNKLQKEGGSRRCQAWRSALRCPCPRGYSPWGGHKEWTEREVERTTGVKIINLKIVPQVGTGIHSLMHSLIHSSFQDFFLQHVINMPGPGSDPKEWIWLYIYPGCCQGGPQGLEIMPNQGRPLQTSSSSYMKPETWRSLIYELRSFLDLTTEIATVLLEWKGLKTWSSKATQNKSRTGESHDCWGLLGPKDSGGARVSRHNSPTPSCCVQGLILLSALASAAIRP